MLHLNLWNMFGSRGIYILLTIGSLVLVVDAFFLGLASGVVHIPGELSPLGVAREGARLIAMGLGTTDTGFSIGLDEARTREDIGEVLARLVRTTLRKEPIPNEASPEELKLSLERLKADYDSLRRALEEARDIAGLSALEGSGVIVRAYDAEGGYTWDKIVHDRDIRDIVNLLFDAGARGIEVGGERLVTRSSIRCAGPVVLVNNRVVPVDPVVIRAVGEPNVLARALQGIRRDFRHQGKRLEIVKEEKLAVRGFRGWM